MKKTYKKPQLKAIEIKTEQVLLSASTKICGELGVDGAPDDWD